MSEGSMGKSIKAGIGLAIGIAIVIGVIALIASLIYSSSPQERARTERADFMQKLWNGEASVQEKHQFVDSFLPPAARSSASQNEGASDNQ